MSDYEVSDLKSIVKAGAEVITEVAKAEQEQQKTLQSGLDLVKRAGTFLNGVFGPASYELGHVFSDRMRFWRFRNAVDILEKAQTLVEARGLKPDQVRALGFGEGLRLLEVASKEDDPTVQEMWARLMANAVDPQTATKAEKVYVEILNSLSSREAVFLDLLASIDGERGERLMTVGEYNEFVVKMSARAEERWRLFPASERSIAIQNLIRLRCVTVGERSPDLEGLFGQMPRGRKGGAFDAQWGVVDKRQLDTILRALTIASGMLEFWDESVQSPRKPTLPEGEFRLTALGIGLMEACAAQSARE